MVSKRRAAFKDAYALELGLRVGERDPSTREVLTAICMFCEMFGREDKVGGKRRTMDKVAVFKPPFRKDAIRQHHTGQHPQRWAKYCDLSSDDGKRAFFIAAARSQGPSARAPPQRMEAPRTYLNSTSETSTKPNAVTPIAVETEQRQPVCGSAVHWLVNRDIVTVVIGTMPYAAINPAGQNYRQEAISGFEDTMNLSETRGDGSTDLVSSRYRIVVKDSKEFQRFVEYLSMSGSLTHTAKILLASRQTVGNGDETPAIDVARYARYLCAINLQRIAEVSASSWAYTIGLKVAPIASKSIFETQTEFCLHVQLRLFVDGDVTSFHVISIPLSKRRQSDPPESISVFEVAEAALDAITPRWRNAILAVVSDSGSAISETSDNPHILFRNAVASRFERVAKPGFLRVCSAVNQLDSLMQTFFMGFSGGDEFYSKLTELVAYLSRQRSLLAAMQTNVPPIGVNLVAGLTSISDDMDETCSELPPVLPHELVEMRGRQFTVIVQSQMERLLLAGWSNQEIDWIEQEFQEFRGAYFRETVLKEALQKCTSQTSFRNAWSCLQGRFTHLQRFCGALTTAYPTAGDSSYAGRDIFQQVGGCAIATTSGLSGNVECGVSDLSVQAVLQAAQFRLLQAAQSAS
ncbi:hypothetical protein JM18_003501 [Phytophthora kernoviae]|uniref:Uncharacterized protein n=2 Tax=Phytophthora kernoviae TaxID=325452 RepID=A0A921V734_9STRA|nr:hypothetical protein G195_008653 [Phytophthora kernoviae 00238/432]KAG2522578.1 hypothetical protein JM18_003501 [Phytophthora kernoviae]